jgi:hypothetical protein
VITLALLLGCTQNLEAPATLRVCGDSPFVDAAEIGSSFTWGYTATVMDGPQRAHDVPEECAGGGELHLVYYGSDPGSSTDDVPWSFYWKTEGTEFEPEFDVSVGQEIYFVSKFGFVQSEDGVDDAFRAGAGLVLRESNVGALIGVLQDLPLSPREDHPELDVYPGEAVTQTEAASDYALVFDADSFVSVDPGQWATVTVSGRERRVGAVSAQGNDEGPFATMWALWAD